MSTQLILYPQYYKGYVETVTNVYGATNEYMVDAINFNTVNASPTYEDGAVAATYVVSTAVAYQNAQTGGIAPNSWYRVRNILGGATPTYPTEISNDLFIYNTAGIYQHVTGLTGQFYDITINMTDVAPLTGKTLRIFQIATPIQTGVGSYNPAYWIDIPDPGTTEVVQFVPVSADPIIGFWVEESGAGVAVSVHINSISIKESSTPIVGTTTDISDGQVVCDLYQEEDIPLTLSVDDFKNVAEQVKSYSKNFSLPATKRNNQIFNNMFEITRSIDRTLIFNPYVRTRCVLKQDGFIIFEGFLRLIDVKDKEGEISYNVNLYSEVVTIADALKDRKFSDLNFTELEHDYTRTQIKNSWNDSGTGITYLNASTSGFRNAYDTVKYPFINWNQQFSYDHASEILKLTNLSTAFRPCIQLKYLIDRIFADTEFGYSSEFFNTEDFQKLYMDFNWGKDVSANDILPILGVATFPIEQNPPPNTVTQVFDGTFRNIDTSDANVPDEQGYSNTSGWTSQYNDAVYSIVAKIQVKMEIGSSYATFHHRWLHTEAATGDTTVYGGGTHTWTASSPVAPPNFTSQIIITMAVGDTLQFQGKKTGGTNVVRIENAPYPGYPFAPVNYFSTVSADLTTDNSLLQTLRGEIGQWDFLKGIFTMFNLVSMPDENNPNNIKIEPYKDVFVNITNSGGNTNDLTLASRSIQQDWTEKVDVSQMDLKPLADLNKKTVFKFVEDEDDFAFNVFKQAQNGHLYGSLEHDASGFTILEGEKEIIAEPFAATVVKPVVYGLNDFIVPQLYAKNDDGSWGGFENSPRIFYNNGIKTLQSGQYKLKAANGDTAEDLNTFLQFSHLSEVPSGSSTNKDFVFKSHQLMAAVGSPPTDNLYSTYWQPYFNELYHPDTRIMTLKVNLTAADINTFKFTDVVMIKNRSFRVNKIEYKPNSLSKVEFILIP